MEDLKNMEYKGILKYADLAQDGSWNLMFANMEDEAEMEMRLSPNKFLDGDIVFDEKKEVRMKQLLEEFFDNDPQSKIDTEFTLYGNFNEDKTNMYFDLKPFVTYLQPDKNSDIDIKKDSLYTATITDCQLGDNGITITFEGDKIFKKGTKEKANAGKSIMFKNYKQSTKEWVDSIALKETFIEKVKKQMDIDIEKVGREFVIVTPMEEIIGRELKLIGAKAGTNLYFNIIRDED